ncbi:helix-turn-helix domain-containing protein [Peptostreptococcus sp.]
MSFAQKLKDLRKSRGLSQKALAEHIGKTARIISYYENEENGQALPKMDFVQLIADFFEVPITYFDETTKSKTKQDVLVEKLISMSVDEIINWTLIDDSLVESSSEVSFVCDDILERFKINVKNDFGPAYGFDKNDIFYILSKDVIWGYALYVYKINWFSAHDIELINCDIITVDLLGRLYKIIESSLDMKNVNFLDDVIDNLTIEPKEQIIMDDDEVPF